MSVLSGERIHFIFTKNGFQIDPTYVLSNEDNIKIKEKFDNQPFSVLYNIGFMPLPDNFDAAGVFLYKISESFSEGLTSLPDLELLREKAYIQIPNGFAEKILLSLPFVPGSQFVTGDWIKGLYEKFNQVFRSEILSFDGSVQMYVSGKSQELKVAYRVFFHLVENKENPDFPFAFLATYATKDSEGNIKHLPIQYALTEYKAEREKLLDLLSCLNKAAKISNLINKFMDSGEIFHPLRLTANEAYALLCDAVKIEKTGIVFRIPNWWNKRHGRVSMTVTLGKASPTFVGKDAVLHTTPSLTVDGEELTKEEIADLLLRTDGLALIKGKWTAIDKEHLQALLDVMNKYDRDLSIFEALRLNMKQADDNGIDGEIVLTNGEWLSGILSKMRSPEMIKTISVPKSFKATLRPYQKSGYSWLDYMNTLGFGCCLADDMGLGKTIQVLAFLEKMRISNPNAHILLVVPASLLGNWEKEKEKFAPQMLSKVFYGVITKDFTNNNKDSLSFLNITTYGMVARTEKFTEPDWDCIICDEAQAIKNPGTKQTKQIKKLNSRFRIAMTGTPIENDLTNLWSLFDFLNKGLLGSSSEFHGFCKRLDSYPEGYSKLKTMISPFLLRRLKTDKRIISDLPEKMEQTVLVKLSKKQVVLYRKYVSQIAEKIENTQGIERKGIILSSLVKLKQICNHPDQYLDQKTYAPSDSGKFALLGEICETIYEKRERVLVFTQFKELTPYLDSYLEKIFHCKGFVLDGGTSVSQRAKMVEEFQTEQYIPYMILSLKAGGTGLNLTNASHVVHFDRWWNPAVENQATDRAFRIGQSNNVMVYKFVCAGTIEEKIDKMIEAKKELASNIIGSSEETRITEMSTDEILSLLTLNY